MKWLYTFKITITTIIVFILFISSVLFFNYDLIIRKFHEEPIVSSIILVIFSILVTSSIIIIFDFEKIKKQINIFNKTFKNINNNKEFTEKYEELNEILFKLPHIGKVWYEFTETLIDYRDPNRQTNPQNKITARQNTVQVEVFINKESIIQSQTHLNFFETIPGILTGLGLVGTFLAILYALEGFSTDPELIQDSVTRLLSGLGFKFASSLTGIGGAIIFSTLKGSLFAHLDHYLHCIHLKVNAILPRRTAESLLNDILMQTRQQTTDLKEFLTDMDFTNAIKKALDTSLQSDLKPMLNEVVGVLEQSNELSQQNKNEIIGSIKQSIDNEIKKELVHVVETSKTNTSNIITNINSLIDITKRNYEISERLNEQISNSISSSLDNSLKPALENISNSISSAISKMNDAVNQLLSIKESSSAEVIEKMIKEFRESLYSSAQGGIEDLAKSLAEASNTMAGIQDTFSTFMFTIQEKLSSFEQERTQVNQKIFEDIFTKLNSLVENFDNKIHTLTNQMNDVDVKRQEELHNSLNSINGQIQTLLGQIQSSNENTSQKTSEAIMEIINKMNGFIEDVNQKTNLINDQLGIADQKRQNVLENNLNNISSRVNYLIEEINQSNEARNQATNEEIHKVIGNISNFMEDFNNKTANLTNQLSDADYRRQEALDNSLNSLSGKIHELINNLSNSNESNNRKSQEIINQINENVGNLMNSMTSSLGQNLNLITSRVENLLQSIDSQSAETARKNQESIDQLNAKLHEILEFVTSTLETQNNKLNEWSHTINSYIETIRQSHTDTESSFNNILGSLSESLEHQKGVIRENMNLIHSFEESTSNLNEASESVKHSMNQINETMTLSKGLQENLNQLYKHSEHMHSNLENRINENIRLWQREKETFNELENTVGTLIERLAESNRYFVENTKNETQKFITDISEQLAKAVSGLANVVNDQRDIIENLEAISEEFHITQRT